MRPRGSEVSQAGPKRSLKDAPGEPQGDPREPEMVQNDPKGNSQGGSKGAKVEGQEAPK